LQGSQVFSAGGDHSGLVGGDDSAVRMNHQAGNVDGASVVGGGRGRCPPVQASSIGIASIGVVGGIGVVAGGGGGHSSKLGGQMVGPSRGDGRFVNGSNCSVGAGLEAKETLASCGGHEGGENLVRRIGLTS
jgi:hypothetical protein